MPSAMRDKLEPLRPLAVPAAIGAAATVAIGLAGGSWRSGAYVGGSAAAFFGAFEYLRARADELRRNHGRRR